MNSITKVLVGECLIWLVKISLVKSEIQIHLLGVRDSQQAMLTSKKDPCVLVLMPHHVICIALCLISFI